LYGDEEQLNDAFARQALLLEGSYRVSPALTLSLGNALYVSKKTNIVAAENVSTGRTRSSRTRSLLAWRTSSTPGPRCEVSGRGRRSGTIPKDRSAINTAWMAALAGYTFHHQRSSSSVTTGAGTVAATDVDQNRVFLGIQFGYPIVFD
jgi:hypothetical protein